jgi:hypothetical protein
MRSAVIAVLVGACTLPCFSGDTDLQELTGILAKDQKALSANVLKLDGATGSMDLKADALLKDVPNGARIWVKGEIRTELFDSSKLGGDGQCAMPTHWHIFMIVKEWKVIDKPFQRTKEGVQATR